MKKITTLICLALVSLFSSGFSQCAALFEVSGATSSVFCSVSGSSQIPITVAALGTDSLTITNLVALGDNYKAVLFCGNDSFYVFRQVSNGRELEATGRRVSSIVAMNITEYDTATGNVTQSCSGTYTAPPVSIDPSQAVQPLMSVSPNPMGDRSRVILRSDIIDPAAFTLQLLDLNGSIVHKIDQLPGYNFEISPAGLSQGLYFFQLIEDGKVVESGKLLKYQAR